MNLKQKVFSFAAASIFALGLGASAMAQTTTGNVIQKIVPAAESSETLNAWLEDGSMGDFRFSNADGSSDGSMTLGVKDGRGSNAGWNVTLQVGNFSGNFDGYSVAGLLTDPIPSSGLVITGHGELVGNPGSPDGIMSIASSAGLYSEQGVLHAEEGAGTGIYSQPYDVRLAIPAQQAPGTYTAVVTVGIASGPGN